MLHLDLDRETGIVIVRPESALSENDFANAASAIDPILRDSGRVKGLIIYTRTFPGWESFAAMMEHFKFVRDHHKKIDKVALVTDSKVGDFGERVASHFVSAQIKTFGFHDLERAKSWMTSESENG